MKWSVSHYEKTKRRRINPNSKFILIGNTIDGFLDFKFQEFENFEDVKKMLFCTLKDINAAGEWEICLYQVSDDYKIRYKYDRNFRVPRRGKLIYKYSYMDYPINKIIFKDDVMTAICTYLHCDQSWQLNVSDFHKYELDIEITKIKFR